MNPVSVNQVDYLLQRWRSGDENSWPSLKIMLEKQMVRRLDSLLTRFCSTQQRDHIRLQVPDYHMKFIEQGTLQPKAVHNMADYNAYCSSAVRAIMVELGMASLK